MIKLNFDKTSINVNKLHGELGDLGERYYVTSSDLEMTLQFPDLFEKSSDVLDDQENVIDTIVTYEKKTTSTVTEIVDEVEVTKEVDSFTAFDFPNLQTQIQAVIDAHDPTPLEKPKTEVEIMQEEINQLTEDNTNMMLALTELYESMIGGA